MIMGVYRTPFRGLGQPCMGYSDFVAALPAPQSCFPTDSQCVACNQQREDVIANLMAGPCQRPGTTIQFQCDTSPAALTAFMGNIPVVPATTIQAPGTTKPAPVTFQNTAPLAGSSSTVTPTAASQGSVSTASNGSQPAESGISPNLILWIGAGIAGVLLLRSSMH